MKYRLAPLVVLLSWPLVARAESPASVDYQRDIQPLLAKHCYECHGPAKQKSGLRLDTVAGAMEGGYAGPAIVPHKSGESPVMLALTGAGDIPQMPPERPPLSAAEIELFKAWIDAGAPAPEGGEVAASVAVSSDHWAFQPVREPAIPSVKRPEWVRNLIDAFVLARLEAAGLEPSAEADRITQIRRLSLDLLGLPPSPAEVDAFLADTRSDAYEQLVDRLLASPHYGERWGRHWLDLARYADSNGYTIDGGRSIWKYRDWVLDALNRDLPFDQFTIEQLAGDMLPESTLEQVVATGFHRNTLRNEEGGTDPEQFRVESVVDRVSTTGAVFLGLTLGCARCHDHKYDPISQREFYQFFALLNNADEPSIPVPTDQQAKEEPALLAEIAQVEKRIGENDANASGRQADWEKQLAGRLDVAWTTLAPQQFSSTSGVSLKALDDQSLLAAGPAQTAETFTISTETELDGVTVLRLEALTHESLPQQGPGLASNGNFVLSEVSLHAQPRGAATDAAPALVKLTKAWADHSQDSYPVAQAIDGKPETGWAINVASGSPNVNRTALFVLDKPCGEAGGSRLTIRLDQQQAQYALGRFRLSVTTAPVAAVLIPESVRAALAIPFAERNDEQKRIVADEFRNYDRDRLPLTAALAELKARQVQMASAITTSLVMQERSELRPTFIHIRGDFLRPGARVTPGVPAVLPPLTAAGETPNRLDLARWLVSAQNPLTPRVTVNRVWQQYFGQGIVTTENDFGTQGAPPTHPELLDWLAGQFVAQGWSMKALHRLIVTSNTYRQSSLHRDDLAEHDPYNKLLGRQLRLRLDAEVIRDVSLAASGLIAPEIGGPGVYPPQPEGIYRFTQQVKFWNDKPGPDRYRRGLYTYFWRSSPYPFLATFDAPDANTSCTRRVRSNTPLQALTLANDRVFVEAAQALASRILRESPSAADDVRVTFGARLCLAREPAAAERAMLMEFLAAQRAQFANAPEAEQVAPANRPAEIGAGEGAAWTALARVLLNLDEFITRE